MSGSRIGAYLRTCVALSIFGLGCGGASAGAQAPAEPLSRADARHRPGAATVPSALKGGSSDGVTCEDAQAQNVEEIDLHGGGQVDLTAQDFAAVLNNGAYLAPCEVPETSKIQICVAVRAGAPFGVTVTLDPSNPDLEVCVARQVRALAFTSHPKMDIVRVHF